MLDTDLYVHCPFLYVSRYFHAIQLLGILRCIACNIPSLGSVVGLRIQSLNMFAPLSPGINFGRFLVSWNI